MTKSSLVSIEFKKIKTPVGTMILVANQKALLKCEWMDSSNKLPKDMVPAKSNKIINKAEKQLKEYFAGKLKKFDLPLNPSGTKFQKSVWNALNKIPYGQWISYGEQAKRIGNPKAVRAVGGANGKNPIAIIVPCHRVLGSTGKLTGFGGGLDAKKYLLNLENPK